jgi:hypothetical protein
MIKAINITPAPTIRGNSFPIFAIYAAIIGGIACARLPILALIPSISPCSSLLAELEIKLVKFGVAIPLKIAKTGITKYKILVLSARLGNILGYSNSNNPKDVRGNANFSKVLAGYFFTSGRTIAPCVIAIQIPIYANKSPIFPKVKLNVLMK